jgi:hypothetical protein
MGDDDATVITVKATFVDVYGNVGSTTAELHLSTYTWNRYDTGGGDIP